MINYKDNNYQNSRFLKKKNLYFFQVECIFFVFFWFISVIMLIHTRTCTVFAHTTHTHTTQVRGLVFGRCLPRNTSRYDFFRFVSLWGRVFLCVCVYVRV